MGTLGSGNHFLELQVVDEVFDREAAATYGLRQGQISIMIHCGSRGFGYQVCDDYLVTMAEASRRYGIDLPDRQLACAPVTSPEGRAYLSAMACAANYAWANRQMIMHLTEGALLHALRISPKELNLRLVYDVAHNIAKLETHDLDGHPVKACVHRKGATRAFGPGRPEIPADYRETGQPVLIPGDMGTASFVCKGTARALAETFGSTCHGAGRVLSRTAALKQAKGRSIARELEERGIVVRSHGQKTLAEEMPEAYKDVEHVVGVMDGARDLSQGRTAAPPGGGERLAGQTGIGTGRVLGLGRTVGAAHRRRLRSRGRLFDLLPLHPLGHRAPKMRGFPHRQRLAQLDEHFRRDSVFESVHDSVHRPGRFILGLVGAGLLDGLHKSFHLVFDRAASWRQ